MASRESSVHRCEKKQSLGLPGLVIHSRTDGLHLWIYAFRTSIQIVCAWNLSIGSDCLKLRYQKAGRWRKYRSEKVFKSMPLWKMPATFAPSPHSWHPIWMGCQTEEKGESWWNMTKQSIFQVIHCYNCPFHVMPIWPHLILLCPNVHLWTSTHRFTPSRWLERHCTCAYHPPSSPGSSTKHQNKQRRPSGILQISLSINSWQFQRIWFILQLFKYPIFWRSNVEYWQFDAYIYCHCEHRAAMDAPHWCHRRMLSLDLQWALERCFHLHHRWSAPGFWFCCNGMDSKYLEETRNQN